jgi:hypothetical protein
MSDEVTFNELMPRMLCTICDHRGADAPPGMCPVEVTVAVNHVVNHLTRRIV